MVTVTHYLITNRQIVSQQGVEIIQPTGLESVGHEDQVRFRFARYSFDPENSADQGTVVVVPTASSDPTSVDPAGLIGGVADSDRVFTELYRTLQESQGNVLFFIHGFRSDMDITLKTIRKLHQGYVNARSGVETIVTFTWPSQKNVFQYSDDQRDARLSGYAFARVFRRFHQSLNGLFQQDRSIHLLCHSMGNQVLYYLLERLFQSETPPLAMFKEAVLVAADIPFNAFHPDQPLRRLEHLCERAHIYYHQHDLALRASSIVRLRKKRLGRIGLGTATERPDDVFDIDVTSTPSDDTDPFLIDLLQFDRDELIRHWYYLSNSFIINDICTIFKTGQSPIRTSLLS